MDALLQQLSKLSDAELRTQLKAAGQPCGGIAKTTRKFFEKRLAKHLLAASGNAGNDQQQQDAKGSEGKCENQSTESSTDGREQKQTGGSTPGDESSPKDLKEAEKNVDIKEKTPSDGLFYVVQVPAEEVDIDVPDGPMFKGG